LNPLFTSDIGN